MKQGKISVLHLVEQVTQERMMQMKQAHPTVQRDQERERKMNEREEVVKKRQGGYVGKREEREKGNGFCAFPDGMVKRHTDFICLAAANTFGTGADRVFVGRNQLDAATLNRFVQVEVDYDETLETKVYGDIAAPVQAIRRSMRGERVIVSMRNISNAAKLEAVGYSRKEAIQLAVINTIPTNLRNKI